MQPDFAVGCIDVVGRAHNADRSPCLIRANIYLKPFRPHCAEPQRLDAIPAATLTLVLTRTDDVCRTSG